MLVKALLFWGKVLTRLQLESWPAQSLPRMIPWTPWASLYFEISVNTELKILVGPIPGSISSVPRIVDLVVSPIRFQWSRTTSLFPKVHFPSPGLRTFRTWGKGGDKGVDLTWRKPPINFRWKENWVNLFWKKGTVHPEIDGPQYASRQLGPTSGKERDMQTVLIFTRLTSYYRRTEHWIGDDQGSLVCPSSIELRISIVRGSISQPHIGLIQSPTSPVGIRARAGLGNFSGIVTGD